MKIAVVEDDPVQLRELAALTASLAEEKEENIFAFSGAPAFLYRYRPGCFDLLLLDIQMPGGDGMALARQIREAGDRVPLVFVTAVADHVFEGYEVEASQYLLKPVSRTKLKECLDRAKQTATHAPKLFFETPDGGQAVFADEILYLEADAHQTRVVTATDSFLCSSSFGSLLSCLPENFACPHRSYCVNIAHVWQIRKYEAVLDNRSTVPVSRRRYADFSCRFLQLFRRDS